MGNPYLIGSAFEYFIRLPRTQKMTNVASKCFKMIENGALFSCEIVNFSPCTYLDAQTQFKPVLCIYFGGKYYVFSTLTYFVARLAPSSAIDNIASASKVGNNSLSSNISAISRGPQELGSR